ncbi:sialate O-acetylesterase [Bacteroides acidifaciens]|jgi:hypothetical protein|uniref:sialate O-acetylesterase n=1 Tax=Bacteroides acidifaciens TaxID=85831 RepID=UPI002149B9F6|nr:sialate O-acetylesterase [Bacteroides acidifaciens]MCR2005284.1 sialate O-acetylesterase [Bacteroides acidifaciens]
MRKYRFILFIVIGLICEMGCSGDSDSFQEEKPEGEKKEVVDPNFHIYLCFGQSNMGGAGEIEIEDRTVDERFQVMSACDSDPVSLHRQPGSWYKAVPPLCSGDSKLSMIDYFGRTLVKKYSDIKVGVIVVAIGGARLDAFDKQGFREYYRQTDSWQKEQMDNYGGSPYARLVKMGQKAQQSGVIKGILFHQGESGGKTDNWPKEVEKIYNDLLVDLNLKSESVPLLVGELLYQDQGGICWGMNDIIATLPNVIENAHVISAEGCTGQDNFHFTSVGYRKLGIRYGEKMIELNNKNLSN